MPQDNPARPALNAKVETLSVRVASRGLVGEHAYAKSYLPRRIGFPILIMGGIFLIGGVASLCSPRIPTAVAIVYFFPGLVITIPIAYHLWKDRPKYQELAELKNMWRRWEQTKLTQLRKLKANGPQSSQIVPVDPSTSLPGEDGLPLDNS